MCVVSENYRRGYIGCWVLWGTRSEIAAELSSRAGTDARKEKWLPRDCEALRTPAPRRIYRAEIRGSDLWLPAHRAVKTAHDYKVTGNKHGSTHASAQPMS